MSVRDLLTIEDEKHAEQLRTKVEHEVTDASNETIQGVIQDMLDTSEAQGGLGLAAPQIGHPIRAFVLESRKGGEPLVVINPRVVAKTGKATSHNEGCLSVPGQRYNLKRAKSVVVTAIGQDGKPLRIKTKNKMDAFIIQHEIDHLNGVLVCDKGVKENE